jgi:hypothetical protein
LVSTTILGGSHSLREQDHAKDWSKGVCCCGNIKVCCLDGSGIL